MTETLIEKLEAEKVDYESTMMDSDRAYNQAIDDCIAVVRQHEAAQPQDVQDLLRDMRMQVVWSDKATMPIPLYEHMKAKIAAMGGTVAGVVANAPGGLDTATSTINDTLNGKLPTHRNYAEWTAEEFEAVMMQLYPNALPYLKPTPDNPCGHQLRSHDVCKRCGMLGSAEYFIKNELLRGGMK